MQLRDSVIAASVLAKPSKFFPLMKTFILFVFSFHFITLCNAQSITISAKQISLQDAFKEITKQTGKEFIYTTEQIKNTNPINIHVHNTSLDKALRLCFSNQPLTYTIDKNYIIVKEKTPQLQQSPDENKIDITGRIINEQSEPIPGATIAVEGTEKAIASDSKGEFGFQNLNKNDVLLISSVGFEQSRIPILGRKFILIKLQSTATILDETIIKGYYSTSQRLNTGSVTKITDDQIGQQPVSNPLATLQGLVPGLLVTQDNGLPGSNFKLLIRGQNSIQSGNNPLYIIDGVPFLNDGDVLTQQSGINAGSPFNTIDPSQIESIEVLKDADATAIYGSRGANGVILITTKKGRSGKTSFDVNVNTGWGKVTRTIKFMNDAQYLEMRHEAFRNDGITPDPSNAYDMLVWDTTRYTNLEKLLIGNTASNTNVSLKLSGGDENTQFSIGSNYYRETTVFPGNNADQRVAFNLNLIHRIPNNRLSINFNVSFANDNSDLINQDLTQFINLPPVIPKLYDASGNLNWSEGGFSFNNPLSVLLRKYQVINDRLTGNLLIEYKVFHDLKFKTNLGYNMVSTDEQNKNPIRSQDPEFSPYGSAFFGKNEIKSWIIEPQLVYSKTFLKKNTIEAQIGTTLQEDKENLSAISASGYSNDNLLGSTAGATSVTTQVSSQLYHYEAIFGRISYNYANKYIINLTGRRDGSSRFGPDKQFANFGAVGGAWIFSSEKFFKKNLPFITFGKLRASYGITGNDLIGNYNYLDLYAQTYYQYQNQPSLYPVKLYNSDYSWENIKKIDVALELGMLQNRIFLQPEWFKDKSTNQIINYSLPSQTGFNYVLKNFPGVVQNSGWEFTIRSENIKTKSFNWSTSFNISFEKNKLLKFPNLENSSYASRYYIGKPLNIYIGPKFAGVDPQTGVYKFLDKNKQPITQPTTDDYVYLGTTDPKYFGGFNNTITYKSFQLDVLFEFRKQLGIHPVFHTFNLVGDMLNEPIAVLNRWQQAGDHATYEQYTQTFSPAGIANFYLSSSGALLTDASYCRLKNLSLSYKIPVKWNQKFKLENCRIYIEGQNLFVITRYPGADPENQSLYQLPPLKRIVAGLQITL